MSDTAPVTGLALLRAEFPPHQISKLPKPSKAQTEALKRDFSVGRRCQVCGGWHQPEVVHLDYVGHAALTDRLLDADPSWNWEPFAVAPDGLPIIDNLGGLWIRLTVCGVTRIGYGDAQGKDGPNAIKECIGDALRNAAMRFGAALDLWHKGKLHADEDDDTPEAKTPAKRPDTAKNAERDSWLEQQRKRIFDAATVGDVRKALANAIQVAMQESDGNAVDQLNVWAEEKLAQAKPKVAA